MKIYKWLCDKFKGDETNRCFVLSGAFVEIVNALGYKDKEVSYGNIDNINKDDILEIKKNAIKDIENNKNTIEELRKQLKDTEEFKHFINIAEFINLRIDYDKDTPEDISKKIISQINTYSNTIKNYNKLRNSIKDSIRVIGAESGDDIESLVSTIKNLTHSFKEYKDECSEQEKISNVCKSTISDLKEEKNKVTKSDGQNYIIIDNLIDLLQNRDKYTINNNVKNIKNASKLLNDENKRLLKELEPVTKEFERTSPSEIISNTIEILNNIKPIADENTVKILDAVEKYLNDKKIDVSNMDKLINLYAVKEQASGIKNLLLTIDWKGMKPSVTTKDIEANIKRAKNELESLEGYRTNAKYYSSRCDHTIPMHYEELISKLIKDSEEKYKKGDLIEAYIIISNVIKVIEYTKDLYEEVTLCNILEIIRKK